MLETVKQFLLHTPWWVYVLFFYLLHIGFKASKPQITKLYILFILPIIFTVMSLHTLISEVQLTMINLITWLCAIIIGTLLGWLQIHKTNIKVDKQKKLISSPGSWSILIIILVIFSTKYYFGYAIASNPAALQNQLFVLCMLSISGICSGAFIGRLLKYLHYFKVGPYTTLQE